MRINSSNIGMESARKATSVTQRNKSFAAINTAALFGQASTGTFKDWISGDKKEESVNDQMLGMKQRFGGLYRTSTVLRTQESETLQSIKANCMSYLLSLLQGARKANDIGTEEAQTLKTGTMSNALNEFMGSAGSTFFSKESYYHEETESVSFSTTGKVVTADGTEISFNMEMEMSRSFSEYYEVNTVMRQANFCDPLVINLEDNIASVSDQKFMFDIDADGVLDSISELSSKSGYLALDLNEDGMINDGSELFGTKTGDGFKDLSKYDSDKNGWIDENDEIWKKLMIWSKDEDGKDQLYHLAEKGVGAIGLQNVSTEFSLNSAKDNQANARIRSTGIFLYENGGVGSIQHLDLAR